MTVKNDQLAIITGPASKLQEIIITAEDVKNHLCPLATDSEIFMFLGICRSMDLNPFMRDAYLIKYSSSEKAQYVVGYHVYLKRAESSGKLEYWEIELDDEKNPTKATFIGKRIDWTREFRWNVYADELSPKIITSKRSPMFGKERFRLIKTAISQGMSKLFPGLLGGAPYIPEVLPLADKLSSATLPKDAIILDMDTPKEQPSDVPFYDGNHEEKGQPPSTMLHPPVPEEHGDPREETRSLSPDDPDEELRDIAEPHLDPHPEEDQSDTVPQHQEQPPPHSEEIQDPMEETAGEVEEFVPNHKAACFATALELGISDVLMKQECIETFVIMDDDGPTDQSITSRTQMIPGQWELYRTILDDRMEIRKLYTHFVDGGILKDDLDNYLCIRFKLPNILLVERYYGDNLLTMLQNSIEPNTHTRFLTAIANAKKWINYKAIGKASAFNLLDNLFRLSQEISNPGQVALAISSFFKSMKVTSEEPRLTNISATIFLTWQEVLKKACNNNNVNFDILIAPEIEEPESPSEDSTADDDIQF